MYMVCDKIFLMKDNILNTEINQVITELKNYFSLEGLKEKFNYEDFKCKDSVELETSHEYLEEFSKFLSQGHQITIPSLMDMETLFVALDKGRVLSCPELYDIGDLLSCSQYLYDMFYDKKEFYHLNDDALDLNPLVPLKRDLTNSIDPDLTVSDHASSKLREVRSELRTVQHSLTNIMNTYRNRYSQYLSSDVISLKAGQEALPVKVSCKGSVKGAVVSYSSTGETVFMVPYEVIDLRNKYNSLKQEEASEVMKVLTDLSQKCAKQLSYLKKDYSIIERFDRYLASVRYGNSFNGVISVLSDNDLLLDGFFHPLLKAEKVISNTIELGGKEPLSLLITGPNAGGKSILIKAVALSVCMDKLGLLVPCHKEAKIPFIDHVLFLGGDNQSVMDNLSTFSSHLLGIKEITEKATKNSLVIIDEVGEGTSPKDGEAIGVAILKYFEKVGCYTLLTSHFDGMKIYAASDDKTLTGAMEFNNNTLKPTYRLLLHTTGKSYGILLARQMGLSKEIIDDAVAFEKERSNRDTDALMEKLTEQVSINQKKERELENKKKDLDKLLEKRQKAIDALNEEKNSIKMKAESKVERLVEQRIAEINKIWESKQGKSDLSYSQISQAKGELKKIKVENEPSLNAIGKTIELTDLKVGEKVEDEDGRIGTVMEIKKKEVLLDMDGIRIRRKIAGLKRAKLTAKDVKPKKETYASIDSAILNLGPSQGLEVNIIGLHVDEAMRKVVSFLDSARIHKYSPVRIIHGAGTFALKNAVWKYLGNHKEFVKEYRFGGEGEGGLGATVVYLK